MISSEDLKWNSGSCHRRQDFKGGNLKNLTSVFLCAVAASRVHNCCRPFYPGGDIVAEGSTRQTWSRGNKEVITDFKSGVGVDGTMQLELLVQLNNKIV